MSCVRMVLMKNPYQMTLEEMVDELVLVGVVRILFSDCVITLEYK
jgi:hypothetical protein